MFGPIYLYTYRKAWDVLIEYARSNHRTLVVSYSYSSSYHIKYQPIKSLAVIFNTAGVD